MADDQQLCNAALDRGCLDALGSLILALGPTEPAPPEWEEAEAAATQALREVSPQMFSLFIVFPLIMNFRLHSPPLPLSLSRLMTSGGASPHRPCLSSHPSRALFALHTSARDTPQPNASVR